MRFDYRIAKEATFNDWVNDGLKKAYSMLDIQNVSRDNISHNSAVEEKAAS